jgi:hypothetical protein
MVKKVSVHELDEYSDIMEASQVSSIFEFNSAVFCIAVHPTLGEIMGISTHGETFVVTNGL